VSDRQGEPEWALPFESLAVGDSFFIPTLRTAETIYIIDTRAKEARVKVKIYVTIKEGYLGVRVWRVR
jgi:hypothetical protein